MPYSLFEPSNGWPLVDNAALQDLFLLRPANEPIFAPIEAAVRASGLTSPPAGPPDAGLVEALHHGLTQAKVTALALSPKVIRAYSHREDWASALDLIVKASKAGRLVPVIVGDRAKTVASVPLPFADMVSIVWRSELAADSVSLLRRVVAEVDNLPEAYWTAEAVDALHDNALLRAALYARKCREINPASVPALVYEVAALFRLEQPGAAFAAIGRRDVQAPWPAEPEVAPEILEEVQDRLSQTVMGDEVPDLGFTFTVVRLLTTGKPGGSTWNYSARVFGRRGFRAHRDDLLGSIVFLGREQCAAWVRERATDRSPEVRELMALALHVLLLGAPPLRDALSPVARALADDRHERVRSRALLPCYFFAADGRARVLQALADRSPSVRLSALELLSGGSSKTLDESWQVRDAPPGKADPLLTPDRVAGLLLDPDEFVFESVFKAVCDGRLPSPPGFDPTALRRPPRQEIRDIVVSGMARDATPAIHLRLLQIAQDDPSELVRKTAVEGLRANPHPISGADLRRLWSAETVSVARRQLIHLLLQKGGSDLADLYVEILGDELGEDWSLQAEKVIDKIAASGDGAARQHALQVVRECGRQDLVDRLSLDGSEDQDSEAIPKNGPSRSGHG